jgi:hypothetical protein
MGRSLAKEVVNPTGGVGRDPKVSWRINFCDSYPTSSAELQAVLWGLADSAVRPTWRSDNKMPGLIKAFYLTSRWYYDNPTYNRGHSFSSYLAYN